MGGESSGEAGGSAIRVRGIAVVPGRKPARPGTHASHKRRRRRESRHAAFGTVAYDESMRDGRWGMGN